MHFFQLASFVLLPLAGIVSAGVSPDLAPYCVAQPREFPKGECGVKGHVAAPYHHGFKFFHITLESCATLCTCDETLCRAFSWRPHSPGASYGPCTIYQHHLEHMEFEADDSYHRTYWDRSCFNRLRPSHTTGAQSSPTTTSTAPTYPPPPPYYPPSRRDAAPEPVKAPEAQVKRTVVEVRNVMINDSEAPADTIEARSVNDLDVEFQNGILEALS